MSRARSYAAVSKLEREHLEHTLRNQSPPFFAHKATPFPQSGFQNKMNRIQAGRLESRFGEFEMSEMNWIKRPT